MNITFIAKGAESIGLEYISAVLKQHGHKVSLVFDRALFNDDTYINIPWLKGLLKPVSIVAKEALNENPDIIGFSVLTNAYSWSLAVAREIKKIKNVPIIFGGIHPTLVPEEVMSNKEVDIVCRGEGEYALLELVESIGSGKQDYSIQNLWFKNKNAVIRNELRAPIADLDTLPLPDKSLFEGHIPMNYYYMAMVSRGCAYACSYCSEICIKTLYKNKGSYYRQRSVNKVIDEFLVMKQKYNFKAIDIKSSSLSDSGEWICNFLEEYKYKVALPFRAMLHPKTVDDKLARALKSAGCNQIQVGVQTFNPSLRKDILKRSETNADVSQALNSLGRFNVKFSVDLMTGLPGENKGDLLLAANELVKCKNLYKIGLFYLQYLPKTPITEYAKDCGRLTETEVININKGGINNFFTANNAREISRLRDFQLLFRLLPILPRWLVKLILKFNIYKAFHYIPQVFLIVFIDIMSAFSARDYFTVFTLKGYLWEMKRKILK